MNNASNGNMPEGYGELISRMGRFVGEKVSENFLLLDELDAQLTKGNTNRATLSKLYANNMRMLRFIRMLTAFGLYKYGQERFCPENTDVSHTVRQLCKQTQDILRDTHITVKFSAGKTRVMTVADPAKLSEALLCLISNAVRCCTDTVEMGAAQDAGEVVIWIFDNGEPADSVTCRFIHEALENGLDNCDGSGTGLVIARMIAQLHGGKLEFVPRTDGNEFRITLPLRYMDEVKLQSGHMEYSTRFTPARIALCDYFDGRRIVEKSED